MHQFFDSRLHKATNTILELVEDLHGKLICQMLVSNRPGVQIVARIILRC